MTLILTDNLARRVKILKEQEAEPDTRFRIMVDGGGCQGFEYKFSLDSTLNPDDHLFEKDGICVVVDEISLPYLNGATVDYVDDLIGAHFKITNPNAKSSCGCGTSFSV